MDLTLVLVGLAWLAILAMLAAGAATALVRLVRRPERAPFFARLERHGLTLAQAEQAAGFGGLRRMAARCASCATREACRRALRRRRIGLPLPPCPNEAFFARNGVAWH